MKRIFLSLAVGFFLLPLVVGAETISWILPTTHTDGTSISTENRAKLIIYLRGWKEGNQAAKTYFGEVRNGGTSWVDNVAARMNQYGASVAGWVPLKPGDNVLVTASTSLPYVDNTGVTREIDGPEGTPYRWTIPGAVAPPPPPPPPPWQPPPSCNAPTNLTVRP